MSEAENTTKPGLSDSEGTASGSDEANGKAESPSNSKIAAEQPYPNPIIKQIKHEEFESPIALEHAPVFIDLSLSDDESSSVNVNFNVPNESKQGLSAFTRHSKRLLGKEKKSYDDNEAFHSPDGEEEMKIEARQVKRRSKKKGPRSKIASESSKPLKGAPTDGNGSEISRFSVDSDPNKNKLVAEGGDIYPSDDYELDIHFSSDEEVELYQVNQKDPSIQDDCEVNGNENHQKVEEEWSLVHMPKRSSDSNECHISRGGGANENNGEHIDGNNIFPSDDEDYGENASTNAENEEKPGEDEGDETVQEKLTEDNEIMPKRSSDSNESHMSSGGGVNENKRESSDESSLFSSDDENKGENCSINADNDAKRNDVEGYKLTEVIQKNHSNGETEAKQRDSDDESLFSNHAKSDDESSVFSDKEEQYDVSIFPGQGKDSQEKQAEEASLPSHLLDDMNLSSCGNQGKSADSDDDSVFGNIENERNNNETSRFDKSFEDMTLTSAQKSHGSTRKNERYEYEIYETFEDLTRTPLQGGTINRGPRKRYKKEKHSSVATGLTFPPTITHDRRGYYFMMKWGNRMQPVKKYFCEGLPDKELLNDHMITYDMVYSELVKRKGHGFGEDDLGRKYYKAYYFAVSGPSLPSIDLSTLLLTIGDFEKLTLEDGPHKTIARLKLLFSSACNAPNDNYPCLYELDVEKFEIIEECGHLGCGYIPQDMVVELLGKSQRAQRAHAVQVRLFSPSKFGIGKGMLVVKKGIDKIQIPKSMIKVERSKTTPLHTNVVLVITEVFPSSRCEEMAKILRGNATAKQKRAHLTKHLSSMVENVLYAKGLSREIIDQYIDNSNEQGCNNHCHLIGVADPTSMIPEGCVFITGLGKRFLGNVFLTRYPCTEAKDGLVARQAGMNEIKTDDMYAFLHSFPFGLVIFPLCESPLPPKMNDGDLDGDLYFALWDHQVVCNIIIDDDEDFIGVETLKDSLINIGFTLIKNEEKYDGVVLRKLQENPDKYLVQGTRNNKTTKLEYFELTRDEILDGRDLVRKVISHRMKGNGSSARTQLLIKWETDKESWNSMPDIRKMFSTPPEAVMEYVLQHSLLGLKDCKWMKKFVGDSVLDEITEHRIVKGEIELHCRFDAGETEWISMKEMRNGDREDKLILGRYAMKNRLSQGRIWSSIRNIWLETVQDLLCKEHRANEIDVLAKSLYRKWDDSAKDEAKGPRDEETILWGRAYKQSLEIEKHGGKVDLPLELHYQISLQNRKHVNVTGV